jgi:hypothetical protein
MRLMILAAAAALAGCATQPTFDQRLAAASNVDVCEAALFGPGDQAPRVQGEANRRGINCQDYMPAIIQAQQNRAQAAQILLGRPAMQHTPLQPYQMQKPQTTCTTQRIGNQLQTVCR